MVQAISVTELKEKLNQNPALILIDCREKDEHDFCKIEGAKLLPLSEFAKRALDELNPEDAIYIHCHHGGRSQKACEFLEDNGFSNTFNVAGGIEAWSKFVDPKVPRY